MRKDGSKIYYLFFLLMAFACKHPFESPSIPANDRPLVVEGLINAGQDATTTVNLNRVQNLAQADSMNPELHAVILIEGLDGSSYPLLEDGLGKYSADHLNLTLYQNYRLNITTSDGNKYLSDYTIAKKTQPIDSLEWSQHSDVTIYVNSYDALDSTKYYRWDYVETWNYLSNLSTPWGVENFIIFAKDSLTQTDSCWRTAHSTDIITANSLALSEDRIVHYPVATVTQNTEKISNRYSILVRQYALTKEAYDYYAILRKNTQQTGSLFDPQPALLPTNLHCITNPKEMVIGFVTASTVEEKRIFINHNELQDWHYAGVSVDCSHLIFVNQNPTDFRIMDYPDSSYAPYYFVTNGPLVLVPKACTYCTYYGGTNVKPSYW